jgi:hypothetical protein
MPDFYLGTADPTIHPDAGAGAWNVESRSLDTTAFQIAFYNYYAHAIVVIGDDAVAHMNHYFRNTGNDYTIDLEGMVDETPSAKLLYEREQALAKVYVESLPVGTHSFTSRTAVNGYNGQRENRNWFFAIGGYSVWSKGTATVSLGAGGARSYTMNWEYKFFDRYNWDGGKSVDLFGVTITDAFMGRMHREGIAREYNCYGSFSKTLTWGAPAIVPPGGGGGGRGGR